MEFIYNIRNFNVSGEIINLFEDKLVALKRVAESFGHFEKKGSILIDKLPKGQFLARINLHLPQHHIEAEEIGYSPTQALHEAADNARTQIVRLKEKIKAN